MSAVGAVRGPSLQTEHWAHARATGRKWRLLAAEAGHGCRDPEPAVQNAARDSIGTPPEMATGHARKAGSDEA